jgi:ribonuclease P protein component
MRALFMEIKDDLIDGIYVFVAKDYINQMSYDELKKGFLWSLRRLGCLKS